ncbi:MAG: hypothetical protein ACYS1A_04040 [Planctomycetota bacterium]|jgi:Flp pilus assembly protein TadB
MKGYVLISVLMVVFLVTIALGQEQGEAKEHHREDMERQIHLRRMQLEMEEQEAELDFHRNKRKLDLAERKAAFARKQKIQKHPKQSGHHCGEKMAPLLIICFVVHILLAVWVYQDIRKRSCGSGIWIVIVLLTGLLGVLPYTIVRLGDSREPK